YRKFIKCGIKPTTMTVVFSVYFIFNISIIILISRFLLQHNLTFLLASFYVFIFIFIV
ncbi:hypothetical protein L9F63_023225, partial [Diploptera punctata]